ncbi:MAG: response regulator [Thermodesulfobacteriota bacterium]|nr:response regulator [Thermodesulfobacteriota bacterium]
MEWDLKSEINKSLISDHRILVGDDDVQIQRMLSCIISTSGYSFGLASNGKDGLDNFISQPFDCVITDLEMPLMDGMELALQIKSQSPHMPIILMTGSVEENLIEKTTGNHFNYIF